MATHPSSVPDQGHIEAGYRRLAAVVRGIVGEQSLENVIPRFGVVLRELVRCDDLVIWECCGGDELVPSVVSGEGEADMASLRIKLGEGITGKAALWKCSLVSNDAHLDPRAGLVPGTEPEPEAIACIPLVARGTLLGALSLYRRTEPRAFHSDEIELVHNFADVAALVLDNVRTRNELRHLATTDELTGLRNRRAFESDLARERASAQRHDTPLSLLMLDLDNFKEINDSFGHAAGDRALKIVATAIQGSLRETDVAARLGGDEFVVLLPRTDRYSAESLARRLERAVSQAFKPPFQTTTTIGISTVNQSENADLIAEADRFLYEAKRGYAEKQSVQPKRWKRHRIRFWRRRAAAAPARA